MRRVITDLLDWLETFSSEPVFYLVIFAIALFDSVIPAVPSETTVILGGIAAGQGNLNIVAVIALGALGAFVGDSIAYGIGYRASDWLNRTWFKSEKAQGRLEAATRQIDKRGGLLLVTARFIPGGRTAVTLSCGITKRPYLAWFAKFDVLATIIWASYAGILGFVAGERFKDSHTTAFFVAFGAALSVTALIEAVRWLRHR